MELNGTVMMIPVIIFTYICTTLITAYYASATLKRSFKNWLLLGALLPIVSLFILLFLSWREQTNK